MELEVFDPAMCCSTGVCGSSVDPALATFASDLEWLAAHGIAVRRHNLGQEPGVFATQDQVRALLQDNGESALPVVITKGQVRSTGRYPSRAELGSWAGVSEADVEPAQRLVTSELIAELAAVGAAVGSNCEPCLKFHYNAARKLGLSDEQLTVAVRTAQAVKDAPATNMLELSAKLLRVDVSDLKPGTAPTAGLTAEAPAAAPADESSCCGGGAPAAEDTTELMQIGAASTSGTRCC